MLARTLVLLPCLVLLAVGARYSRQEGERVLEADFHHLGDTQTPEWTEASAAPEGLRLDVPFTSARANRGEWVLTINHRHVNDRWWIQIDGQPIGELARVEERRDFHYKVPPGAIERGDHVLSFFCEKPSDDITIGNIRLVERSFRELFDLRRVRVEVIDADSGRPVPARVTITDAAGAKADVFYAESRRTAVRQGILYVMDEPAALELAPGEYRFHATRGTEWSHALEPVRIVGADTRVRLAIRREVETTGWIAADTHIHTLEHSGHGDASEAERLVTLAGEGVELAIATDHNHNIDYRPLQRDMELTRWFTPVVGNEVTTKNGHFNAFPLDPQDEVPVYEETDWVKLVAGIRAKGARVVILNHPRWPDAEKGPYGVFGLDRLSGERHGAGPEFTFDAMELVNATCEDWGRDWLLVDWFALLNRGERISAVGSSDSHTVGDPVGQGRTYVPSATDDPARIDVSAACDAFLGGRTSVSMGFVVDARLEGQGMGATVAVAHDGPLMLEVRVAAASWIQPDLLRVFANGDVVHEQALRPSPGQPFDETFAVQLDPPRHDLWIVAAVTGPGVTDECWRTLNPFTLAATNPIRVDADGDGYESPRDLARALVEAQGADPAGLRTALGPADRAVRIQAAALARERWLAEARARLDTLAGDEESLRAYLDGLPRNP
jgi:hypothetical protein